LSKKYETPTAIVSGIAKGDKKAEASLAARYRQPLLYLLEKRTGDRDHAMDLCQETFRILIEKLRNKPLQEPEKLAAYMQSIANNLFIADIRKRNRRKTYPDIDYLENLAMDSADQYQELSLSRMGRAVRSLISELDNTRDSKILYRFYIDEVDKIQICDELDLSHRHFDKVISRARLRLRELIQERHEEIILETLV